MLDLYAGIWDGRPLGANDYVICADEKTSIQARCRCHPTLPPGKARTMRIEHDYGRGGALAYLAAWDVHRGQVTGRCEDTTGIAPFARLVEQVMTTEPYASADRVFWIAITAPPTAAPPRPSGWLSAWPTAQLIHLPAHASWLDQAEIYFSVVQRKVLTPNDFTGLDQIRDRLAAFETRYNAIARPFHLEVHPRRPQRPAPPDRCARQEPASRPGSLTTLDPPTAHQGFGAYEEDGGRAGGSSGGGTGLGSLCG